MPTFDFCTEVHESPCEVGLLPPLFSLTSALVALQCKIDVLFHRLGKKLQINENKWVCTLDENPCTSTIMQKSMREANFNTPALAHVDAEPRCLI